MSDALPNDSAWQAHPWFPHTLRHRFRSRLPRRYLIWSYMRALKRAMDRLEAK
jgi:hypothetical protein